ncbi:MAG: hypothetical protein SPK04_04615 [Succinivibrionaceae bacterium]|nr:hypothetical protein [Succinivibrionaceae bacterium]
MDLNLLKYHIKHSGDSISELAIVLDINSKTLYNKLNGKADFSRKEIQIIISRYKLQPEIIMKIFFDF